jgi:hypothetical protein
MSAVNGITFLVVIISLSSFFFPPQPTTVITLQTFFLSSNSSFLQMEIKSANDGLLTNVEVLELLKETRALRGKEAVVSIDLQHRESIEIEVFY